MTILDQLVYKITGDTSAFNSSINKADTAVDGLTSSMGASGKASSSLTKSLKTLGAGLSIGAAFLTLKNAVQGSAEAFGDFETSLNAASTLFGDVDVNMDNLKAQIIDLSSETGVLTDEIGKGLYSALSAGVPVTEDMSGAMDFMTASAKLAKAGFTDIDTAVSTTAKTMNAYGLTLDDVDQINTVLIQTQNKGITTVGELGQSLAQVTPTAASFGVSFEEVGASLATMTAQGTATAQATTQLNALIAELGKKGTTGATTLEEAAKAAGLTETSFSDLLDSGLNLGDILNLIADYGEDTDQSMVDMFSSIEAGKVGLALTGDNAETFADNLKAMGTEADVVGEAYEKVMNSWEEANNRLKTAVENLGIAFANNFLPKLTPVINKFTTLINKMSKNYDASEELQGSFSNLESALSKYNDVLEKSEGKTDALTQAMVSQAKAALNLALQKAQEAYADANEDLEKYNNTITKGTKWIEKYESSMSKMAEGTGYTTDELNRMTEQERNQIIATTKGVETMDAYNTQLIAREEWQKAVFDATVELSKIEEAEAEFINLLTQGYLDENEATKLLLDAYPELKEKVLDNVDAYKAEVEAKEESKVITNELGELQKEKIKLSEQEKDATEEVTESTTKAVEKAWALRDAYKKLSEGGGLSGTQFGLDTQAEEVEELIDSYNELDAVVEDTAEDLAETAAVSPDPSEWDEWVDSLKDAVSWVDTLDAVVSNLTSGLGDALTDVGEAIYNGEDAWAAFAAAGLDAMADILTTLGDELAARAVVSLLSGDLVGAGLAGAGSTAAYVASGVASAAAASYEVGTIEVPNDMTANIHKGEMVLTQGIAEEARQEGISITPTGSSSSTNLSINVIMDSKVIAKTTVDKINLGQAGTINVRVVK